MQPATVLLMHHVHEQVAFGMSIFEGRLKFEAQMFVESTSCGVRRRNYSADPLAAKLLEGIAKAAVEELSIQPLTT
jgi:hypothetical protein